MSKFILLFENRQLHTKKAYKIRIKKDHIDEKHSEIEFIVNNIPSILNKHPRKLGFYDNECYEWMGTYVNETPMFKQYMGKLNFKKKKYSKSMTARKFIYAQIWGDLPIHPDIRGVYPNTKNLKPTKQCPCKNSSKRFMNCHMYRIKILCENKKCVNPFHFILDAPIDAVI